MLSQRHPSHKLTASIYCEIDGLPVELEPLELSTAGLFVETPTPAPLDTEVDIFLRIGEMRFEATGHVVQTISCELAKTQRRKPGYGLLFTNIDETSRAQLRRGIEALVVQRKRPEPARPALTSSGRRASKVPAAPPTPSRAPSPSTPRRSLQPAAAARVSMSPPGAEPPTTPRASFPGPAPAPLRTTSARPAPTSSRAANPEAPTVPRASFPGPAPGAARASSPTRATPNSRNPGAVAGGSPAPVPSRAPAAVPIDPRELEMLDKLRAELREVEAKPPWGVLGLSQGADPAQARDAFFAASKRYHPHLYARYVMPEIKQLVTELFIVHKRAYTLLRKTNKNPLPNPPDPFTAPRNPARQSGVGTK